MTTSDQHDALVLRELSRHFEAEPCRVWDDPVGELRISCAWFSARDTGRPWGTLVTYGMSRQRMTLDSRATDSDTARVELVSYTDADEPAPDDIAAVMRQVARIPFDQEPQVFLGWGHTVPMLQPVFAGCALTTALTLVPIVRPDKGEIFHVGEDPVSLLWLTFLTDAEYALKKAHGENAVLDLFSEHQHPVALDRGRASYV
jgi:hypothetical protein